MKLIENYLTDLIEISKHDTRLDITYKKNILLFEFKRETVWTYLNFLFYFITIMFLIYLFLQFPDGKTRPFWSLLVAFSVVFFFLCFGFHKLLSSGKIIEIDGEKGKLIIRINNKLTEYVGNFIKIADYINHSYNLKNIYNFDWIREFDKIRGERFRLICELHKNEILTLGFVDKKETVVKTVAFLDQLLNEVQRMTIIEPNIACIKCGRSITLQNKERRSGEYICPECGYYCDLRKDRPDRP